MEKLLGIEMYLEEFDHLMCEQSKGKELVVQDGKVVAIDHIVTEEELLRNELAELENWFLEYDNQVKQYSRCLRLGLEFDKDINELDNQAKINAERITEIRNLLKNNE